MIRRTGGFLLAGLLAALYAPPAFAGTSYPMVMSLRPVAVQAGTTADLTVHSRYSMEGSYRVLISGSGVTGQVQQTAPKPPAANSPATMAQTAPPAKTPIVKKNSPSDRS